MIHDVQAHLDLKKEHKLSDYTFNKFVDVKKSYDLQLPNARITNIGL